MTDSSLVATDTTPVREAHTDVLSRTWAGHPRGAFLVAFTELWERFSYWGVAGLLVLFLTAPPETGGWGWQHATAVKFYGWYGGLAFVLPVVGAWLANNLLGERRCILWGGITIALGHALLAVPALIQQPHALESSVFMLGLLCIVSGTGLLKPTISSIIAHLYPAGGTRRDDAFAWFFVAIYIGAFLGALLPGALGERVGWHYGLGAAGAGMLLGIACYAALQEAWLGDVGSVPVRRAATTRAAPRLTRQEWHRIAVIAVQGAFTVCYAAGFYQMFGLLNLYAHEELDRTLGGFEIPTTWMQTISLLSFFVCVPALSFLWRRLATRSRNPSASYKLACGLATLAAGYLIIAYAEGAYGDGKPSVLWLVATYVLFGLGDAFVWANQVSLTSKLAPARYSALFIGAWYICIGLGTWLTGSIGALVQDRSYRDVFLGLAAGCAIAAMLLAVLTPTLRRWMHGAE
jgi:POT family proton-dependent oligopeptide transporter